MTACQALLAVAVWLGVVSSASEQYRFDHFTTTNGLPQNTISGIGQTPDDLRQGQHARDSEQAPFHRTGWFLALVLVGALAAAGGTYLSRIRRLEANERRLAELVDQRTAELQELTQQFHIANDLLAELATVDGLTDVANRRRLDQYLAQEWLRASRGHTSLSLLLLDVDEFKRYNDTYGHQAGDRCLKAVADALRATVRRAGDLPARFGGEEFAVVLPDTPAEGARAVAESIRGAIADLAIPHAASTTAAHVTVSIGVATALPSPEAAVADLLAMCDRALYRAKEAGRNRSVVADPSHQ